MKHFNFDCSTYVLGNLVEGRLLTVTSKNFNFSKIKIDRKFRRLLKGSHNFEFYCFLHII